MFLPVTIAANPLVNPLILASVRTPIQYELETDWLAGHVRFEPANPSASYLIGIAWQLRLRAAQLRRRRPFACELRDTDFAALAKISAVDL